MPTDAARPEERERLAVAGLWLAAVAALVLAFQSPAFTMPPRPGGPAGILSPLLFGLLAAAGFLAALYRPRAERGLGAGLGLGAGAVPLALAGWGAAPVAIAFALTAAAAGFAAARERDEPLAPRRLFGGAACAALGTLAAGWVMWRIETSGPRSADLPPEGLAAAAAGAAFVAIRLIGEALAFPPAKTPTRAIHRVRGGLVSVGLEAAAWTVGSLLALYAGGLGGERGPGVAIVLLFAFALLAAEAGRQSALRRRAEGARAATEAAMAHDPLTGLAAEARLEPLLAAGFARSLETAEPFAVALFDVDHLERLNEASGRAAGSAAVKALGAAVGEQVRPGRTAVRSGGGRAALLLDATDGAGALQVAEAVRRSVEAGGATVSAGVASAPEVFARSGDELLLLAEKAARHAKRLGRNLCLLDLGGGRYRDGSGAEHDTVEEERVFKAPQIFA
jgi:diguanylate cyclase (GGDEF)-like protein